MGTTGAKHGSVGQITQALGIPLVKAMTAHKTGDHSSVVNLLWPIRHDLYQVGGSHAQRDIFFQVLVDSTIRTDQSKLTSALLSDVTNIGFQQVEKRTLYSRAATAAA